ncbi:hypothetical protein V5O48_012824 [Marasmius crinis-equi]|uniref:Fungal-type protein kinase domain-containing protein n=1 Tax=Marasmius crinis-equi TaxID=585013 RepID=A0ABR3F1T0_9AGAR
MVGFMQKLNERIWDVFERVCNQKLRNLALDTNKDKLGTGCEWTTGPGVALKNLRGKKIVDIARDPQEITRKMQETLRSDPKQKHAFGMTLEETTLRLWFYDGAAASFVVSDTFNLHGDWKKLVHVFIFLGIAEGGGDDKTMIMHDDSEPNRKSMGMDVQDATETVSLKSYFGETPGMTAIFAAEVEQRTLQSQANGDGSSNELVFNRIVIEATGQSFATLRHFDRILEALKGGLRGTALHEAGFLHTDISTENIFFMQRNLPLSNSEGNPLSSSASIPPKAERDLVPVLVDFETALSVGNSQIMGMDEDTSRIQMGSWRFMASEVQKQDWIFMPPASENVDVDSKTSNRLGIKPTLMPFRQHALHDVESFVWIAIWMLFNFATPGIYFPYGYQEEYRVLFPASVGETFDKRELNVAVLGRAMRRALPSEFGVLRLTIEAWTRSMIESFQSAYEHAALRSGSEPNPAGLKLSEKGRDAVQKSMEYLEELRDVVKVDERLQTKLTAVRTTIWRKDIDLA